MRKRTASAPRIERLDPGLVPVYRAMSPAQRVMAGLAATDLIRERLRASIREAHPDWSDAQISDAVSRRMLSAGD